MDTVGEDGEEDQSEGDEGRGKQEDMRGRCRV
jgi:hypothetical protein